MPLPRSSHKILFITLEPIAKQMAGPAIRAFELAQELADEFDVTVFSPCRSDLVVQNDTNFKLMTGLSKGKLYQLAAESEIIYLQANVLKRYPRLSQLGKYLVLDLYDPYLFSLLAQWQDNAISLSASYRLMHQVLEKHMVACDFSICASERQRDYWIGRYCAIGRLAPDIYQFDPSLRKLIDVVPFGLPDKLPSKDKSAIRGQVPGVGPNDQILIWGGGIWEWFDPLTVIEAVAKLGKTHPHLKLFFMGWKSPNPQVPLMPMAKRAKKLAQQLGILGSHIIFHDSWVPYQQRVNYLLDADIAVSAHFDLPETRYSFRTRVLDYLWAGLPIITSQGDQLAEMIASHNAGLALPYGDVDAWVQAITKLTDNPTLSKQCKENSVRLAAEFKWSKVVEPLRQFCRQPYHLPGFAKIKMPGMFERAKAVYARGGANLFVERCQNAIEDLLRK